MRRSSILHLVAANAFALLMVFTSGAMAQVSVQQHRPSSDPEDFLESPPEPSTLLGKFTLVSLGDLLYSHPMANKQYPKFQKVVKLIKSGDVTIANREGIIFNPKTLPSTGYGGSMLWGEASLAKDEKALGIDMVSLANNHATDWGGTALLQTKLLHEEVGIVTAGAGRTLAKARQAGILDTPKGRIALIATTSSFKPNARANDAFDVVGARTGISTLRTRVINLVTAKQMASIRRLATERASPRRPAPARNASVVKFGGQIYRLANKPGLTYQMDLYDLAGLLKSVREAKKTADFVVFYIHTHQTTTGNSDDTPAPPDFLIKLAHDTIDAGADVFMAGGLHTMRGIEVYKGKPIFYGLGSFFINGEIKVLQQAAFRKFPDPATGMPPKPKPKARSVRPGGNPASWYDGVVAVTEVKNGKPMDVKLYPLDLGSPDDYNRMRRGIPHFARGNNAKRILANLQQDSGQFGTKITIEGSIGVIRIH